jgi:hypothetical protein
MSLSNGPSALLRAMSLSNGRWTFYEAVILSEANLRPVEKMFWAAESSFFRNLVRPSRIWGGGILPEIKV